MITNAIITTPPDTPDMSHHGKWARATLTWPHPGNFLRATDKSGGTSTCLPIALGSAFSSGVQGVLKVVVTGCGPSRQGRPGGARAGAVMRGASLLLVAA